MPVSFRYFALHYLDDWIGNDSGFVEGLASTFSTDDRRSTLCRAATYYGVARNLTTILSEARLTAALEALDAMPRIIDPAQVDAAVEVLARELKAKYGRYAVSAASKFLWLRDRAPVVIFDSQTAHSLWARGGTFGWGDYPGFRECWLQHFAQHLPAIVEACHSLPSVKPFSLACDTSDTEFITLIRSPWFHERVFDKYLWWTAGA